MRYTTPVNTLAVNSSGERQLEAHHLDDNFAAQDNAIQAITRALFASGGVAKAGAVTLTGLNLRVQDRVGVTLDTSAALHVTDLTLDLTTLPAGKGTVVMTTDPVTVNRTYTDIVTQENLTDTMTVRLGRLLVVGAGASGVTLDASGYPVAPQNTVPVAHVTRTAGGATLDEVLNPAIQVNSSVSGPAGADGADGTDGVSVTGAEINGSGHLILTLSDASTIDAGEVGSSGGAGLPSGGTTGQVLTKLSGADGDVGWQTPAVGGTGGSGGGTGYRYYRLNITANGGGDRVGSSELILRSESGGTNLALGMPATASSEEAALGFPAANAVNGTAASGDGWITAANLTSAWLQVDLGTPQTIWEYAVAAYPTSSSTAARSPRDWALEGSNDGTTWTPIHSVAAAPFTGTPAELLTYPLAEQNAAYMPVVTTIANVLPGGAALLVSSMPPRMVYRHTDGTPYYGPVYSTTP
ncbi:discoidin domain-containing protein [Deinococcus daejeonensis]|uniref:F5/8 type C domain-containing protein n=1 Tax=Deinococcus daejeonensis TaxID=1007098 RepID=A0ABQ2IVG3_9DEIO|nr:discoidin domain-containing protein [Deinococcus daejeonensis]GGN32230.1 hypothetical protein GCM10010842_08720 [Deinococcus daejeonensis]